MGYMASGKSFVGKVLAKKIGFDFIDLDTYIERREGKTINNIFESSGEIYFRKIETKYLKEVLDSKTNTVLSLGGGTPCYGNNIDTLLNDKNTVLVYLKASVRKLSERLLQEKDMRPLVNHILTSDEMMDFVGKHLFERQFYYNKARVVIDVDNKSKDEIIESIIATLF